MTPLCLTLALSLSGALEARELDLLTNLITAALDNDPRLDVLSSEDLRTMLEAEVNRQVADCSDSSCLGEIADALGARFVIAADVGRLGEVHVMTIAALDAVEGRAVSRRVVEAESAADLGRRAAEAVRGLVEVEEEERVIVLDVRATGTARGAPPPDPGPSALVVAGGVGVGAGALLLASGGGAWIYALGTSASARSGSQLEAGDAFRRAETASLTGNILLGAGALVVATGGVLLWMGANE